MSTKSEKVVKLANYKANERVIEVLEDMLKRAKDGSLVSLVAFCANNGGTVVSFSGGDVSFCDILTAFEYWKYRSVRDKLDV